MNQRLHYSLFDELLADPKLPMPERDRVYTMLGFDRSMTAIELDPNPIESDWRVLSDAVNLMETLIDMGVAQDDQGLLADATTAMRRAAERKMAGGHIRFDGPGVKAMRSLIDDFGSLIKLIPHRMMIRCHRMTEKRIAAIRRGAKQSGDVVLVSL